MKRLTIILIAIASIGLFSAFYISNSGSQADEDIETINWMTWEEVEQAMKTTPKKVFVDVYTCWCGPCKMFSKTTLSDQRITKFLNKHYYAIKFDAHHPEAITIGGKTYNNPNYVEYPSCRRNGTHELAYAVATSSDGRLAFPTTVYFDEDFNKLTALPGMLKAKDLEQILTYYSGDHYMKVEFEKFKEEFAQYKEEL